MDGKEKKGSSDLPHCLPSYMVFLLGQAPVIYFALSYDCVFAFDLASPAAYWLFLTNLWGSFTCQFTTECSLGTKRELILSSYEQSSLYF